MCFEYQCVVNTVKYLFPPHTHSAGAGIEDTLLFFYLCFFIGKRHTHFLCKVAMYECWAELTEGDHMTGTCTAHHPIHRPPAGDRLSELKHCSTIMFTTKWSHDTVIGSRAHCWDKHSALHVSVHPELHSGSGTPGRMQSRVPASEKPCCYASWVHFLKVFVPTPPPHR